MNNIYVSTIGNDGDDGSSWANAKLTIGGAISVAVDGDLIWTACGTYNEQITLTDGVQLYGGFAGDETSIDQRDWVTNVTIIKGNGGTVVTISEDCSDSCQISGFTLTGGARAFNCASGSAAVIAENVITGNRHNYDGMNSPFQDGAIKCVNSNVTVIGNLIYANIYKISFPGISIKAGGIYISGGSPVIINNTIVSNHVFSMQTVGDENYGGGIYAANTSATMANNIIVDNVLSHGHRVGGGIFVTGGSPSNTYNCIYGNSPENLYGIELGLGCFSLDPQFYQPNVANFELVSSSPCINNGESSLIPSSYTDDLKDLPRIVGTSIDMGCYEYQGTPIVSPVIMDPSVGDVPISVTLSTDTANATIHYTTDGSAPTQSSQIYTDPIDIPGQTTLNAVAFATDMAPSTMVTGDFTWASLVMTPAGGTTPNTVNLSSASTTGVIHYTVDGSDPTSSSQIYASPFGIDTVCTVKAALFLEGYPPSDIVSEDFDYAEVEIVSEYPYAPAWVSLSLNGAEGDIVYTTDGSDPDESSSIYEGAMYYSEPFTMKARQYINSSNSLGPISSTVFVARTEVIYVSTTENASQTGVSWAEAFNSIGAALSEATAGDCIWVASGVYHEEITLIDGVQLLGGFDETETTESERDFWTNVTTIQGNGSDSVVSADAVGGSTILDGFTIKNGNRGVSIINGSGVVVTHNIIEDHSRSANGTITDGAISSDGSSPLIGNNVISGNSYSADRVYAAGVQAQGGTPVVINNTIVANSISAKGKTGVAYGGGIYITEGDGKAVVANNIVYNNAVSSQYHVYGGGIQSDSNLFVITNNCVYDNRPENFGGATPASGNLSTDPLFINSQNDYRIQDGSPCIAAADKSLYPTDLLTDLSQCEREIEGRLDIGAYEYQIVYPVRIYPSFGKVPVPVFLNTATPDATITYTTDNSVPTSSSTVYTIPFFFTESSQVQAAAFTNEGQSRVTKGSYLDRNQVIYVSPMGDDHKSGTSWGTAKLTLSAALSIATPGDTIWAVARVYQESVTVPDGVLLLGGFNGTETSASQRNWSTNLTVIDGQGSGTLINFGSGQNSGIDGFTLQNASRGISSSGTITVGNCIVTGMSHTQQNSLSDGAIKVTGGIIFLYDSLIYGNSYGVNYTASSVSGGGLYLSGCLSYVVNTTISSNTIFNLDSVVGGGAKGGGIYVNKTDLTLANSIVTSNRCNGYDLQGGGISVQQNSCATLVNNCFYSNVPSNYSGVDAGAEDINSDPLFVDPSSENYQLQDSSPCIGRAQPNALPSISLDLNEQPRVVNDLLDMGPYENQSAST